MSTLTPIEKRLRALFGPPRPEEVAKLWGRLSGLRKRAEARGRAGRIYGVHPKKVRREVAR